MIKGEKAGAGAAVGNDKTKKRNGGRGRDAAKPKSETGEKRGKMRADQSRLVGKAGGKKLYGNGEKFESWGTKKEEGHLRGRKANGDSGNVTEEMRSPEAGKRPKRTGGTERVKGPERAERTERGKRPGRAEGTESRKRPERTEGTERVKGPGRAKRTERVKGPGRAEGTERGKRPERAEGTERVKGPGRAERTERGKRPESDRRPEWTERRGGCAVSRKCGGCQLSGVPYKKQLRDKQQAVEELLGGFGKVQPIIGMKNPLHYRNKVCAAFSHDRRGNAISGVYEANSHIVVPIDSCELEDQRADAIIVSIRGLLKSFKIKTYDEDNGYGLLRHVLVRTGFSTGEIMVVLVTVSPIFPSRNNFIKALRKLHPEITTIVQNINGKDTSMVLGEKEQVLYGKGYIEDRLCGKLFRISPKSFYQVNPVQTETLYQKAIDFAELTGKETVLDAYCGIGTIGIIASSLADKVIGVELNQDAIRDANTNARRNRIKNIDFYQNDAGVFMCQLAEQKLPVDVVFMDPPRAGSDEAFLKALCMLAPKKIVYVSCNPETLKRDLQYLIGNGYRAKEIQPVDMFPGTRHVETVVLLERKVR